MTLLQAGIQSCLNKVRVPGYNESAGFASGGHRV